MIPDLLCILILPFRQQRDKKFHIVLCSYSFLISKKKKNLNKAQKYVLLYLRLCEVMFNLINF